MKRCTPITCNNPTLTGGLCESCLRFVGELELRLWGPPDDLGIPYWFAKKPMSDPLNVSVAEKGPAEQFDEPQIVHDSK